MIALICFVLAVLTSPFKSKSRLEAENAVLRHQLIVLRRRVRGRAQPTNNDRWFLVQMYRWFPSILMVVTIVQPETLVRWHRAGFRSYWRWKSRPQGGRPQIATELRALIRRMSVENPLWGCAVQRRRFPVGANPIRQLLQPEAIGAVMEVTKWLKPSISVSRIGDSASVQAATRVNAEQSSKRTMRRSTRQPFRGRLIRLDEMSEAIRSDAAPG
jgi:hypothetical protein